jgi:hypothetical protein
MQSWLTNVKQNAREIRRVNYRNVILFSNSFGTRALHKVSDARESSGDRLNGSPTQP